MHLAQSEVICRSDSVGEVVVVEEPWRVDAVDVLAKQWWMDKGGLAVDMVTKANKSGDGEAGERRLGKGDCKGC